MSTAAPISSAPTGRQRLTQWAGPLIALVAFVAAAVLLYRELRGHSGSDVLAAIRAIPPSHIALALGLTALNYTLLSGYDGLAVWYLGRTLKPWRVMLGAFVGYAMSHNFTWMLGGTTARFRLYLAWGLSAVEIVKLFAIIGLAFWTGFCFLAGIIFLTHPMRVPRDLHLPIRTTFWLGPILLGTLGVYLAGCAANRPITIRGWRFQFPPLRLVLLQALLASCDLLLQAAVMYVLLPTDYHVGYWRFANAFLLAYAAALISHVPGGVGVLEVVILGLVVYSNSAALFGSLLVFRGVFYLLPLLVALTLFLAHEWLARHRPAPG